MSSPSIEWTSRRMSVFSTSRIGRTIRRSSTSDLRSSNDRRWTDSLRDLVTTIRETNLTIQGNRLGIITKKVTSWAAIIAVPTFVTGFYGMNVPYPGFSEKVGLIGAVGFMLVAGFVLYFVFKRKDWL